jgi:hypothetical protein
MKKFLITVKADALLQGQVIKGQGHTKMLPIGNILRDTLSAIHQRHT